MNFKLPTSGTVFLDFPETALILRCAIKKLVPRRRGNNSAFPYKDMKTRRKFLLDCSFVIGVAALVPASALSGSENTAFSLVEIPGFDAFYQQLNTTFTLEHAGQTVELTLVEAVRGVMYSKSPEVSANENFTLTFDGPAERALTQNTYEFVHPELGALAIFVTPVGKLRENYCRYEAVFSRPPNAAVLAAQLAQAPRPSRETPA